MARSGLAKGANSGHITEVIERKPKPSQRKGVSLFLFRMELLDSEGNSQIVFYTIGRRITHRSIEIHTLNYMHVDEFFLERIMKIYT